MVEPIFPSIRIIPSEDVISRNGFVRELEERLFMGDSTMLAGPRRIGKTSVAIEVLNRLRERGIYTVAIDLSCVTSAEKLGFQLIRKVFQVLTGVVRPAAHTINGLLESLSKPEILVKVEDLEITSHLNEAKENPETILDETFHIAEVSAETDHKRMVIMFDEWQEIARIGGESLLKRLRSIFQRQSHVSYLFLGSEPSTMRALFADRRQAFYRFATMLDLPDITTDEWNEYVHRKLTQAGITIDRDAFDELMDTSGGHAYDTMVILQNMDIQLRLNRMDHVDISLVRQSIRQSYNQLEALYNQVWQIALNIRGADKVLTALMEGTPPYRADTTAVITRALDRLIDASILSRQRRGEYQFADPMFKTWLQQKMG
ncbi:AAA family ATPase [Alicyclobacillus mengziensis]|uniref:ATP-binding protein n=1 Tax=Alicyclobacillus mengziensis TaxID=2931921 RepID=A0A9X7VUI2_9BACL|nr:AAA family ATPase [Alicyclobacillus mengziensis]QSO45474.1 ATP-binding protein [Alicyclobacillus mengziensis]